MSKTPLFARKQPGGVLTIADERYYPGKILFVHSDGTDSPGYGENPNAPFASIDYAIGNCVANALDRIFVLPGHAETITGTDITVDVAGITIEGIGRGSLMPRISHNHANAEVSIAADNVVWKGIRHSADITGVAVGIEIEDGVNHCHVLNNTFDVVTTTTDEFVVAVRTNNASNFVLIEGNDIDMGLGGAVSAISLDEDTDSTTIRSNRIQGDFSTACINGINTLSTKLDIDSNLLINGNSGNLGSEPAIELVTGSTGTIRNNLIVCNLATLAASVVADTCMLFNNYYNEDISGGATGGLIGTASAND